MYNYSIQLIIHLVLTYSFETSEKIGSNLIPFVYKIQRRIKTLIVRNRSQLSHKSKILVWLIHEHP